MQQKYLTNTPLEEALGQYLKRLNESGIRPVRETVAVREALGRRAASAIYAVRSVPHYLACAMDGIALRAEWTFGASETAPVDLDPAACRVVDTGDRLPEGCDAVIMIEDIIETGDRIRLITPAVPWQHIRQIGEDFCAGDMLACSGTILTPALLGALVAGGITEVEVIGRPKITLIPTGDEIVPPTAELLPGQIPEFNTTVYGSFLEADGACIQSLPIVPDDTEAIRSALSSAIDSSDMVLLLAGSSAGRDDLAAQGIQSLGEVVIHGLAIRPGKPAVLGICRGKPVVGLPGYPVSGLIVLEEIVRPVLRRIFRLDIPERPTVEARLTRRLVSSLKYQEYIRVRLTRHNGALIAAPLDRGAGILTSYARADGLLVIPVNLEGLEEGSSVTIRMLRPLAQIENLISVIGSHDPLLDEMADLMDQLDGSPWSISSVHAGSIGGILAIRRREAQVAGIHLLDEATGEYNTSIVRRFFPKGGVLKELFSYAANTMQTIEGAIRERNPFFYDLVDEMTSIHAIYTRKKRETNAMDFDDLLVNGLKLLQEHAVEMIFTDLTMPEMDGESLFKRVMANPKYNEIPVVVISSIGNPAKDSQLLAMGVKAVVKKPVSPAKLAEVFRAMNGAGN